MENDTTNQTTNQLLISYISEATVFIDTAFPITACNRAASAHILRQTMATYSFSSHSIQVLPHPAFMGNGHLQNIKETNPTLIARHANAKTVFSKALNRK